MKESTSKSKMSLYASLLGKLGGKSRSARKVLAARENGKKGGRPRKEKRA